MSNNKLEVQAETHSLDLEAALVDSLVLRDFKINLGKEEEVNKVLETFLMSLRNSLEEHNKGLEDKEEVSASNKEETLS